MQVHLTAEASQIVEGYVHRGEFSSGEAVVEAAVRFLKSEEDEYWSNVNARVGEAERSVAATIPGDRAFWDRLHSRALRPNGP